MRPSQVVGSVGWIVRELRGQAASIGAPATLIRALAPFNHRNLMGETPPQVA